MLFFCGRGVGGFGFAFFFFLAFSFFSEVFFFFFFFCDLDPLPLIFFPPPIWLQIQSALRGETMDHLQLFSACPKYNKETLPLSRRTIFSFSVNRFLANLEPVPSNTPFQRSLGTTCSNAARIAARHHRLTS